VEDNLGRLVNYRSNRGEKRALHSNGCVLPGGSKDRQQIPRSTILTILHANPDHFRTPEFLFHSKKCQGLKLSRMPVSQAFLSSISCLHNYYNFISYNAKMAYLF
jgi:hypothetical protein